MIKLKNSVFTDPRVETAITNLEKCAMVADDVYMNILGIGDQFQEKKKLFAKGIKEIVNAFGARITPEGKIETPVSMPPDKNAQFSDKLNSFGDTDISLNSDQIVLDESFLRLKILSPLDMRILKENGFAINKLLDSKKEKPASAE